MMSDITSIGFLLLSGAGVLVLISIASVIAGSRKRNQQLPSRSMN